MSASVGAIALASLATFVVNFLWFGPKTFFPIWWRALGRTDQPGQGASMGLVFGMTIPLPGLLPGVNAPIKADG